MLQRVQKILTIIRILNRQDIKPNKKIIRQENKVENETSSETSPLSKLSQPLKPSFGVCKTENEDICRGRFAP